MIHTSHLLSIREDSRAIVNQVVEALTRAGMEVVQSFDLQTAKAAHSECTCTHHGSDLCDCQMVMLLVYDQKQNPVTLVAHGQDGITHLGYIAHPGRSHPVLVVDVISDILFNNLAVPSKPP